MAQHGIGPSGVRGVRGTYQQLLPNTGAGAGGVAALEFSTNLQMSGPKVVGLLR